MRRLSTLAVIALSTAIGIAAAFLLYKQAWRIPVVQNLRDAQLFAALWIIAAPCAALLAALTRVTRWPTALKSAAICLGIAGPAYGLTASFDRVRTSSRDKAIVCNLRQLSAAADQFFLENNVKVIPRMEELVGPDKYIKAINRVVAEDYANNFPLKAGEVLTAILPNGRMLNYAPAELPAGYKHVFEPGERLPWRAPRSAANSADSALTPFVVTDASAAAAKSSQRNAAGPAAPRVAATTNTMILRELGQPKHKVHRGTMCASCHGKKT